MPLFVAEVLDVDEFMKDVGNHEEALNTAADLALTVSVTLQIKNNNPRIKMSHSQNSGHSVVTCCVG